MEPTFGNYVTATGRYGGVILATLYVQNDNWNEEGRWQQNPELRFSLSFQNVRRLGFVEVAKVGIGEQYTPVPEGRLEVRALACLG